MSTPPLFKWRHFQAEIILLVDRNAAYPIAIDELKAESTLAQACDFRQNKYLNNIV